MLTPSPIVGADGGDADVVFVDATDAVARVPEAGDPNACPAGKKRCNGACVPTNDPQYGCGNASCTPCSLPHTLEHKCTADGRCERGSSRAGWKACGVTTAGCTSNLSSPDTCGDCDNSCAVDEVCNPRPALCNDSCDVGLTRCGNSCVDTLKSELHCGPVGVDNGPSCTTVCPGTANGDPVCSAGACSVACRPGFAHCNGNNVACVQQQLFYVDADTDGFGDISKPPKLACPGAPSPGLAALAGDCNDTRPDVRPGQTKFFLDAYPSPINGEKSYDYNCDGVETEPAGVAHFTPPCRDDCAGGGLAPLGSGRKNPGVNDYCGSTTELRCVRGAQAIGIASVPIHLMASGGAPAEMPAECGVTSTRVETPNPCR